jgi:hypothetical protein
MVTWASSFTSAPGCKCGQHQTEWHRSNTSTVALRVVGSEPSAWGHNRATMFLRDINTGTWPSRLGESRIWDSKIWSWIPRDSDLRMTALARTVSNCERQTHPLVREAVKSGLWRQVFGWKKLLVVSLKGLDAKTNYVIGGKPAVVK